MAKYKKYKNFFLKGWIILLLMKKTQPELR